MPNITFQEGVPAVIDVSAYLPAGDRYHGGYYARMAYTSWSYPDLIPGVYFDPIKKAFTYDGTPLNRYGASTPKNPGDTYFAGAEMGPYGTKWAYPPRAVPLPTPIGGVQQCLPGNSKHTRAMFCPWDGLIHFCGGDFSSSGLIGDGHQDGRMILWNWSPETGKWGKDYPVFGRAGEYMPLSPDIMGFDWDKTRQIWWITYGDSRNGVQDDAMWKSLGGLATAAPNSCMVYDISDAPVYTFDPKLPQPRYNKLANMPWNINLTRTRQHAYDDTTKRLYKLYDTSSKSVRVYYLDTTNYETDPLNMPWTTLDLSLAANAPENLTGDGKHQYCWGEQEIACHIDEAKRVLYFFDARTPAVLGLTLQGHPSGEHKFVKVCELPDMPNFTTTSQTKLAMCSSPFVWIPEHRVLVLVAEPLYDMVGNLSFSYTINVDTGVVEDGPRFPSRSSTDPRPFFPNAGVWYPPTQELVLYAFYPDTRPNEAVAPQAMFCYKWTG